MHMHSSSVASPEVAMPHQAMPMVEHEPLSGPIGIDELQAFTEHMTPHFDALIARVSPKTPAVGNTTDSLEHFMNKAKSWQLLQDGDELVLAEIISAGKAAEVHQKHRDTLPTPEEQVVLDRAYTDAETARNIFFHTNLRLVKTIADQHRHLLAPSAELLDLVQEGMFGLSAAVDKFDPSYGTKFSTLATYWVRQSLTRGSEDHHTVRVPVNVASAARRELREATDPNNDFSSVELSAATIGVQRVRNITSLQTPVGEDTAEIGDFLPDPSMRENTSYAELTTDVAVVINEHLTPRQKTVVDLLFGLHDGIPREPVEIAEQLGTTRQNIEALVRRSLKKLRAHLDPEFL